MLHIKEKIHSDTKEFSETLKDMETIRQQEIDEFPGNHYIKQINSDLWLN